MEFLDGARGFGVPKILVPIATWIALRPQLVRESEFVWRPAEREWPVVGRFRGTPVEVFGMQALS